MVNSIWRHRAPRPDAERTRSRSTSRFSLGKRNDMTTLGRPQGKLRRRRRRRAISVSMNRECARLRIYTFRVSHSRYNIREESHPISFDKPYAEFIVTKWWHACFVHAQVRQADSAANATTPRGSCRVKTHPRKLLAGAGARARARERASVQQQEALAGCDPPGSYYVNVACDTGFDALYPARFADVNPFTGISIGIYLSACLYISRDLMASLISILFFHS